MEKKTKSAAEKTEIQEKCWRIENQILGAKNRWLHVDNPFWKDFLYWVRHSVKKQARSNPYRFSPCCWTFQKRKRNGYEPHSETTNFNYYLINEKIFKKYFLELAIEHGWARNKHIFLPTIDRPHLDRSESPSFLNPTPEEPESLGKRNNRAKDSLEEPETLKLGAKLAFLMSYFEKYSSSQLK